MTTLNDFKALFASVPAEGAEELYSLFSQTLKHRQRMVELAAEQGVTLTVNDQVRTFLTQDE